jgi:hypothetical protein
MRDAADRRWSEWTNAAGQVIGVASPTPPGARGLVLVFHGNGGCASWWSGLGDLLVARDQAVRILEYPGYGARSGVPSEASILAAAREAAGLAAAEARRIHLPLIILGESLGGGVASQIAASTPDAAGIVSLISFTSLADTAARHYPWLPVRWLLRDRYDSAAALRDARIPLLCVVQPDDRVVPAPLGERLHAGYAGPKRLVRINGGHDSGAALESHEFWTAWDELFSAHVTAAGKAP